MKKVKIFLSLALALNTFLALSQEQNPKLNQVIQNTSISGEWFLGFNYNSSEEMSQFSLKRGYFTIKTKLNDVISVRYTQDITLDKEGGDMGNIEMRLKYLYMKVDLKKMDFLRNSYLEFGMVHRPWVDFEQKYNGYRVQGTMYSDRYDLTTSADFGILWAGLIGGKIDTEKHDYLTSDYAGKYGSFALGIFNGGGYHAVEKNNNKVFEGRLTLRPMPEQVPGLQFSYALAYGKANTPWNNADYAMNLFYISAETRLVRLMGQYYTGKGSYSGEYTDALGYSYNNDGYSLFGELFIPGTSFSLFSRYDLFNSHQESLIKTETVIAGLTYRFLKSKVLFNYDRLSVDESTRNIYEIALEINF